MSGSRLKWVAIICMLIDHTAATLVYTVYFYTYARSTTFLGIDTLTWWDIYYVMRAIGRVAFPIFCFLLVEGFNYTSSKSKYVIRLAAFCLISEIPFDLAFRGSFWNTQTMMLDFEYALDFTYQNVFFTLLLGFCALWLAQVISDKLPQSPLILKCAAVVIAAIPAYCIGEYLVFCDYGGFGVALIAILQIGRLLDTSQHLYPQNRRICELVLGVALLLGYCYFNSNSLEVYAVVGFVLCLLYSGARGSSLKWFFYVFYPTHLLILAILERCAVYLLTT